MQTAEPAQSSNKIKFAVFFSKIDFEKIILAN